MDSADVDGTIEFRRVEGVEAAEREKFLGTPTALGRDAQPAP